MSSKWPERGTWHEHSVPEPDRLDVHTAHSGPAHSSGARQDQVAVLGMSQEPRTDITVAAPDKEVNHTRKLNTQP